MSQELVSVVIPTYNRQEKVVRAVKSVLDQTYQAIEVIVSDDGSTDNTSGCIDQLIAQYGNKVRYIRTDVNCGVSSARNRGIEASNGEFIAFLDSDDTWEREKIKDQVEIARKLGPDVLIFCAFYFCDDSGERVIQVSPADWEEGPCFLTPDENPLEKSIPPPASWLISSTFVDKVGLFDERLETFEDADFAYRVYEAGFKGYFLSKPLVRCYAGNDKHLSSMSIKTIDAKEQMVRNYKGRVSRKNIARIYNSLAKDYLYFSNRRMASFSLFRAFFAYPLNTDYFGKAFRAWFLPCKKTEGREEVEC